MAVLVLLQDLGADDVGGHEVRGELETGEVKVDGIGQSLQQFGLAQARDAFQENVALAQQPENDLAHDGFLAGDPAADGRLDVGETAGEGADQVGVGAASAFDRSVGRVRIESRRGVGRRHRRRCFAGGFGCGTRERVHWLAPSASPSK